MKRGLAQCLQAECLAEIERSALVGCWPPDMRKALEVAEMADLLEIVDKPPPKTWHDVFVAGVDIPLVQEIYSDTQPVARAAAHRGHAAGHLPALAALPHRAFDGDRAGHHLSDPQGPPLPLVHHP